MLNQNILNNLTILPNTFYPNKEWARAENMEVRDSWGLINYDPPQIFSDNKPVCEVCDVVWFAKAC